MICGAVATGTRPVGPAFFAGLVLRFLERRGALRLPVLDRLRWFRGRPRAGAPADLADPQLDAGRGPVVFEWRRLRPADPVILLAATGLIAYVVYLWDECGEPFAFADAESAPGWDQRPGRSVFSMAVP